MNSTEFFQWYGNQIGRTVEDMLAEGRVVLVCGCGDEHCHGFGVMLKDQADAYINEDSLPNNHYKYRYPKEGE